MFRQRLVERDLSRSEGKHPRGREVARIEAFSDTVFGFSITLLVVSLEVPKSFNELLATTRGFGAFAISFFVLFMLWKMQYEFFREYGLNDNFTIWVNAILMFLVLFFVYPLKFLFTWVMNSSAGVPNVVRGPDGRMVPVIQEEQIPTLMTIYGLGFGAVFLVFVLLHLHAYRRRSELGLDAKESYLAVSRAYMYACGVLIALSSIALAVLGGPNFCFWAGMIYCLMGPVFTSVMFVRRYLWDRSHNKPNMGSAG